MSVSAITALLISSVDSVKVHDRLIVLGPHHTGTSIVAKALDGYGFYLGDAKDLLLRQDNPLKYWERRDVVALNDARISSAGLDRTDVPSFVGYGYGPTQGLPLDPSPIVEILDGGGKSWATKDPRLSLTAVEWLPRLTKDHHRPAPVCILTVRHPLGFANTMMRYSLSLGLAHWGSIWMRYMTEALRACKSANVSVALVSHADLVHRPLHALVALESALGALGVRLPSPAPASRIAAQLLDLGLGSAPADPEWLPSELAALPEGALSLYVALNASLFSSAPLPHPRMHTWMALPPAKRKAREAYATLLTTSDEVYLAGALTLGTSIRSLDTLRELLALVTPAVPASWHDELKAAGFEVISVDEVEEFWWGQGHERCRSYDPGQDARWGHESTKLRLWELEQYDAILYIDADGLMLGPADTLFAKHGFAAERGLGPWFNAGVMLIRPSRQTFAALIARGAGAPPTIFGNVVDCTEQGLLNAYFDGSDASRAVQLFDVVHPHDPGAAAVQVVVHWITLQCPKPWDHEPGRALARALPVKCSRPLYDYWWRLYNRTGADVLAQSPELRRRAPRKLLDEYERCSPMCPRSWLADGFCDHHCDNAECAYDQGDCWRKHRPPSPPSPPPAPHPPPMPPHVPQDGCECSNRGSRGQSPSTCFELRLRIAAAGGTLPTERCGCFPHDGSHVCYTVGQCPLEGNPSARYQGVFWRHCTNSQPRPPPPPPFPPPSPPSKQTKITLRINSTSNYLGSLEVEVDQGSGYEEWANQGTPWYKGLSRQASYEALVGVRVQNPTPNSTWLGAVEYSSDGGRSYAPLVCTSCIGNSRTATIVVGTGKNVHVDLTQAAACGEVCHLAIKDGEIAQEAPSCSGWCSKRKGNGKCHSDCYTAGCDWDGGDCNSDSSLPGPSKCAERCPPSLLNNGVCDAECNVEACMWDGYMLDPSNPKKVLGDCDHGHTECYTDPRGKDYRGSVNETEDGDECIVWEDKSNARYVNLSQSGLGGHNHCRNPTTMSDKSSLTVDGDRPWCWRKRDDFDPNRKSWGYCNVQSASKVCRNLRERVGDLAAELSTEATAAPLIAASLIVASVLVLGLLVFVHRMLKVRARACRGRRCHRPDPARPFARCSGTSKCTRSCSSNCKPLRNLAS